MAYGYRLFQLFSFSSNHGFVVNKPCQIEIQLLYRTHYIVIQILDVIIHSILGQREYAFEGNFS